MCDPSNRSDQTQATFCQEPVFEEMARLMASQDNIETLVGVACSRGGHVRSATKKRPLLVQDDDSEDGEASVAPTRHQGGTEDAGTDKENASQNASQNASPTAGSHQEGEESEDEEDYEEVGQRILNATGDHYMVLGVSREGVTDQVVAHAHARLKAGFAQLFHANSQWREPGRQVTITEALTEAFDALHSEDAREKYRLEEAEAEAALVDPFAFQPWPWQQETLEFLEDPEDRLIYWIGSAVGNTGKSFLKSHLVREYGALVVSGAASGRDIKYAVCAHMKPESKLEGEALEAHERFKAKPIIVVDIPRPMSWIVKQVGLYATLEEIQSDFHACKFKGGQVSWGDVPLTIFVFANCPPEPDKLSTDRLQSYVIEAQTLKLLKDTRFDAQLAEQAEKFRREQADWEQAVKNGLQPEPSDTRAYFELCYKLAAGHPTILSERMHQVLQQKGYNSTKKAMNKWLRDYFKEQIEAGSVKEINQSHRVAWKGFGPA